MSMADKVRLRTFFVPRTFMLADDADSRNRSITRLTNEASTRWLYMLALPIIVAIFYVTAIGHFAYTPDDTYIYLQFAKNLIHGNGFSFNPGEATYGVTSPLWLFMISLGGAMGTDLYMGAKVIDLLFASFSLILCYMVAYEIIRDVAVGLCATVAFSLNAWMLRWAGTGMETSLSVALMLAVVLFCLRNEYFMSVFFASLLTLVRPEASLIVILILVDLYLNSHNRRRALSTAAALVIVYLMVLAPWFFYAYKTFGTVLPNSGLAKSGLHLDFTHMVPTAVDVVKTVGFTDAIAAGVVVICAVMLVIGFTKDKSPDTHEDAARFFFFRQSLLGIGWILLLPLIYVVADVNVVSRYLLLVTPLLTIYAFSFLYGVVERSRNSRHAYSAVFVLAAFIMLQNQFVYRIYVKPGIDTFEQGMQSCLIPIGKWFKDNTPPETRIVAPDIGAVGFYSDRRICDAAGLTSGAMLPYIASDNSPDDIIAKRLYENVCTVDYVIHRAPAPDQLRSDSTIVQVLTRPFHGLTLSDSRLFYYTVYKVKQPARASVQ